MYGNWGSPRRQVARRATWNSNWWSQRFVNSSWTNATTIYRIDSCCSIVCASQSEPGHWSKFVGFPCFILQGPSSGASSDTESVCCTWTPLLHTRATCSPCGIFTGIFWGWWFWCDWYGCQQFWKWFHQWKRETVLHFVPRNCVGWDSGEYTASTLAFLVKLL